MYVYCVESFAHIECYGDCSRRGAIWLNPFATVLFSVCSAVTVVLFCTRVAWMCLLCLLVCREKDSSPVSLQLLRGGIWACMGYPLFVSLLGFGIGTMLANFHV